MDKPQVIKMHDCWLWRCYHAGWVGDSFNYGQYRDPWTAALTTAIKHWVLFHYVGNGEEL